MKSSIILTIIAITFFLFSCGKPEPTAFEVPETEKAMKDQYQEFLKTWPCPYEELMIRTSLGTTHVLSFGKKGAQPLILMHATLVTSTMWKLNAKSLAEDHQVYAIDYLGGFGLSRLNDLTNYITDGQKAADWLKEVIEGLNLEKAQFAGASYGGWACLELAYRYPDKVEKLALFGTGGIADFTWGMISRAIPLYSAYPRDSKKIQEFIDFSLGPSKVVHDYCAGYLTIALAQHGNKTGNISVLPDEALKKIQCPVLDVRGNQDAFCGNGQIDVKRTKSMKNFKVVILEGGHMISIEKSDEANKLMKEFF